MQTFERWSSHSGLIRVRHTAHTWHDVIWSSYLCWWNVGYDKGPISNWSEKVQSQHTHITLPVIVCSLSVASHQLHYVDLIKSGCVQSSSDHVTQRWERGPDWWHWLTVWIVGASLWEVCACVHEIKPTFKLRTIRFDETSWIKVRYWWNTILRF